MNLTRKTLPTIVAALGLAASNAFAVDVSYSIQPDNQNHEISPLIYGTNHRMYMTGAENLAFYRIGGNRLTAYNWENNWSNAGSDWQHSSDNFMVPSGVDGSIPGITYTHFVDEEVGPDAKALLTLQMAGYVSADGDGPVSEAEAAPSSRWVPVYPRKNAPFSLTPNVNDNAVYIDEMVNFLVARYGRAADGGVFGYSLDNEPALWSHTHPLIHPDPVGAQALVDRSIATAAAVKDVDPTAKIFGPALFGFSAYTSLQGPPDWENFSSAYPWYIDYYLDQMRSASDAEGQRLLDVLDLHWYSEATGDQRVTNSGANSRNDQIARLQATRTLWDPDYVENSWIGQYFSADLPLIPHLKDSISTYYPGTEIAFTEYSYGGPNHITGGISQADLLGIFGKYDIYASTVWLLESESSYIASAYRLFRNYDGANSTFGNMSVNASMSDKENSSVYAAVDSSTGNLHVIVLNKNLDESIDGAFDINSTSNYNSANAYAMTQSATAIQNVGTFSISGNSFSYSVPALSAYHFVIEKGAASSSSSSSSFSSNSSVPSSSSSSLASSSFSSSSSSSLSSSSFSSSSSSSSSSVGTGAVTATVNINNDWGSGYCAILTLNNTGVTAATWNVSVSVEGSVNNLWNGNWSQSGSTLSVSGVGWNSTIQPGQADTSVGFCASR